MDRPVGRAVTHSSLEREVWGSNLGPVKSDKVLPTARYRCDISFKGAVLPGRNDAEIGPANSLHALAYYSEYNERFDLMQMWTILKLLGGIYPPIPPGFRHPCVQQLVASNFAKNGENFERELCLNVIILFSIIVSCLVVTWCSENVFWVNRNGGHKQLLGGGTAPLAPCSDGTAP